MKRKIYSELLKWKKENKGEVALLIDGARRIGKSYIVEQFAKENYIIYIFTNKGIIRNNIVHHINCNGIDNISFWKWCS